MQRARAAFAAAVANLENVETGRMFGRDCAFVNGNVFVGLHAEGLFLRLPDSMRNEFRARHAAKMFEPMPGRLLNEYMTVPDRLLEAPGELRQWIGRALSHARTLPAREREERKPAPPPAQQRRGERPQRKAAPRPPPRAETRTAPTVIVKKRRTLDP